MLAVIDVHHRDRQCWLGDQLASQVTIVWTDNRSAMLSVKGNASTGYHLRLHHMFQQAPEAVWQALIACICHTDTGARHTLRTYVQRHQHLIRHAHQPQRRYPRILQPRGHHFNLEGISCHLNRTYFATQVQARITWSRRSRKRPCLSIRFGSYQVRERLICVHRLLDQSFVPRYVIESVVFHEMLHQLLPARRVNGRWRVHSPEFRRQVRRFPYHQQADQWKRCYLRHLLAG